VKKTVRKALLTAKLYRPGKAGGGASDNGIPELKTDNPGGEWLQNKIENAAQWRMQSPKNTYNGTVGAGGGTTGWFKNELHLPVEMLKDLPGSTGEEAYRHSSPKLESLEKSIAEHGYHPDPILVHVREDGQPFIVEGNHRVAEAVKSGRRTIPTEIKYLRGAESVDGPLHPSKVISAVTGKAAGGRTGYADGDHSLDITDKMRDAVKQGLPAFKDGGEVDKITAYHASPQQISEFKASPARGSTFFASEPGGGIVWRFSRNE
jgi:hypothetical protein